VALLSAPNRNAPLATKQGSRGGREKWVDEPEGIVALGVNAQAAGGGIRANVIKVKPFNDMFVVVFERRL
jgi:hypothetical protein